MNNRLVVVIDIDGRRAEASAASLNKSVLGLGGSMQSASSRGASAFDRLTQSMDRAATRARSAVSGVAGSFANLTTRASAAWSAAVNQIGVDTFARNMRQFIQSPTQAAGEAVEALLLNMGPLGVAALGAGLAFAAASVGVYKLVSSVANAAEEIDNISVRTGLSRQEVQQMSLAAETMGVNFGALESAMRPLSQALSDNTDEGKKAKAALKELGVVVEDDFGRFIGLMPFLERFGARLAELPPGVERVNAASKVLGKGASELVPLLVGLGKALNDVRESGAAMSDGLIDSGLKVDGYFDRLMLHLKWLRNAIAAPFVITVDMVGSAAEWISGATRAGAKGRFGGPEDVFGGGAKGPQPFVGPIEPTAEERDLLRGNEALEKYTKSLQGAEILEKNYAAAREKREEAFAKMQATRGKGTEAFEKAKATYEQALAGERALKAQIEASKTSHDAVKKAAEERLQAEESARRTREQAMLAELEGLDKIDEKYRLMRAELARKVGVDGSPAAFNELQRAQAAETGQLQLDASNRALAGSDKVLRDSTAARRKRDEEAFASAADLSAQIEDMERQRADSEAAYKITALGQVRDAQIAALEQYETKTVEQQVAAVRQRAQIEQEYAEARAIAEIERIDAETRYRVESLRAVLDAEVAVGRISAEQRDVAVDRLNQLGVERARQTAKDLEAAKGAIQAEARNRELGIVRSHNQKIFDDYKRQFEGIFDQLMTRTVSLGSLLTSVVLTALKNVLSSQVAALFTRLMNGGGGGGGTSSPAAAGGGGGILGRVLGLGGAFGGLAPGAGPGGTPPFVAGGGGGNNGLSGLLGAQGASVKGFLSRLGGLGRGGTDVLGNKLGSIPGTPGANAPGVGGVTGGAMLAGGGLLAMDGLRRGGLMGLAETTAGGALIGAKFGGPMGALIGGAVGAIAGSIRLLFKGAVQKAKDKVREVYGIDIDNERATQIAALAKQSFGGNLDMAVRSPQIRDMIQLYAEATGKNIGPRAGVVRAATLAQSGGTLYQAPSYESGRAVGLQSSLPSLQSFVVAPAGGGGGSTTLKLDYQATVDVLSGHAVQAVSDHPDVVADSMSKATRSNYGRREHTASQLSPGTLTR